MTKSQKPWPREWLMTDERMGERLWDAIDRLPFGRGGIVFRHYGLEPKRRELIGARIAEMCNKRGHLLGIARDADLARWLGAALVHNPDEATGDLPFSRSVHSLQEAATARDEGAALVFVSPVFETRSHPGQRPLGKTKAVRIAREAGVPAIALGGMDRVRYLEVRDAFHGWAAIDAWLREEPAQPRN